MTENKWADTTPSVPFGGLHGSGSDKTQFERIVELERDLAAAQEWREAVLNELIVAHIYTKEHDTNPRKAIQDAITWSCQVALDPAVSSDARALIANELRAVAAAQEARQRAEALAEGYRKALIHERTALSIVRERQCHEGVCTVSLADIEKGIALLDAAIDAAREGK